MGYKNALQKLGLLTPDQEYGVRAEGEPASRAYTPTARMMAEREKATKKPVNALAAEDSGSGWPYRATQAYNLHKQVEGSSALPRSAWKAQNISLFE
jgi:hypothetical protein